MIHRQRYVGLTLGLVVLALTLTSAPRTAQAQRIVVTHFYGKMKKAQARLRISIIKALRKQGMKVIPFMRYKRRAKKNRISPRHLSKPEAVRKLARDLTLDGVLTARVYRKKKKYEVKFRLLDLHGNVILKMTLRLKRPRAKPKQANKVATLIKTKLEGVAKKVPVASKTKEEVKPEQPPAAVSPAEAATPPDTAAEGKRETAPLPPPPAIKPPPVAKTEVSKAEEPLAPPGIKTAVKTVTLSIPAVTEPPSATAEVEATPAILKKKRLVGPVPDVLFSVGLGINTRMGLHPKHDCRNIPSLRLDTRFFLGSFLDVPVLKDIGLGGMYNAGWGIEYGVEGEEESWAAAQNQWQGELIYRLALHQITLAPAFLFRIGYGSTSCLVSSDDPRAVSAGYNYPYGALDIHLMLFKPLLRAFVSAGYLFSVSGWGDIDGSGSGFNFQAGFELNLFNNLHVGFGYDLFQFVGLKVGASEVSDIYQGFFSRVGWNYH